ncbi:DUF4157 domain-containing protein [Micromonospora sp. WMMD714]|uniref:eCIS core domain-containing protein n=1 Tax=Micromonospora sp. WMMD714 TaxID=3016097 RepID=UPI00249AC722|nr:DUF4157 domain-containing protein [Micromonospora sp. WMMD714]WFE63782.1 DUF4157 domain-containing protein [Micromonospora sp. WMMD714]
MEGSPIGAADGPGGEGAGPTGGPQEPPGRTAAGRPDGADAAAARTAAQFAAAGLPTAQVWPPPGFEVAYLAAEATRAAEEARASDGGRTRSAQPDTGTGRGGSTAAPGHDGRSDPEETPPSAGEVRPVEVAFARRRGRTTRPVTTRPVTARPGTEATSPADQEPGGTTAPPTAAPGRLAGSAAQDRPDPGSPADLGSRADLGGATGSDRGVPADRRRDGPVGVGQDRPVGNRPEDPARATGPVDHRGGMLDEAGAGSAPVQRTPPAGSTPAGVTSPATAATTPTRGGDPAGPPPQSRPVADRATPESRPDPAGRDTTDNPPAAGRDTYRPESVSPPSTFFLTRRPEQSPPTGSPSGVDRDHGRAGQGRPGRGPAEAVQHPPVPSVEQAGLVDRPEPWTTAASTDAQVTAYPMGVVTVAPAVADGRPGPAPTTVERAAPVPHRAAPPTAPPAPVGVDELPEQVPAALVDGFRQQYGVDVAAVPVWRGAEATAVVQQAGARAATRGGEVLLPASAGPLDAPPARALLAHELAHVVQQRAFGAAPPAESTGAGRDLEARALAAEHAFGGGGPGVGGPLPPVAPLTGGAAPTPPGTVGTWGTTPGGGLTWQANPGAGGVPPAAPPGPPAAHPLQRASMDTPAATLDDLRALVRGELDQQQDQAADPPAGPPLDALRAEVAAATAPPAIDRGTGRLAEVRDAVERLRAELRTVADRGQATAARLDRDADRLRSRPGDRPPGRPVDLDDPDDLEELAGRLYGRLRGRLRQELLVDRERSGRLTRFR